MLYIWSPGMLIVKNLCNEPTGPSLPLVLQIDISLLAHLDLISMWMTKTQYLLAPFLTYHLKMARHMHFCGQQNFSLGK